MTAPDTNRDSSPDSSTSSQDANSSRLHLPPHHLVSADAAYEGDTPNLLADHLFLRPQPPSRSSSWHSILKPASDSHHAAHHPPRPSSPPRSTSHPHDSHADHHVDLDHEQERYPARPRPTTRSSHSRSKSRVRNLKWYQRPSPIWFFPGTFLLAMSGGMIISPKLEIYTQLICRAMPVEKSHVSLPPPVLDAHPVTGISPVAGAPISTTPVNSTTTTSTSAHTRHDRLFFEWSASPAPVLGVDHDQNGHLDLDSAQTGDSWSLQCQKSSAVQAAVAQLALVLALMMGVLSALTTGWWGAFSDRRGRKPVLLLALCGTVMMDSVFLLVVNFHSTLSYNFLFVGPFLDGVVGGWATAQAAVSAYISDSTSPGSRARVFSLLGGCLMGGFACGPLFGSALITWTGGWVLAPFYVALGLHCAFVAGLALVLPESLSHDRQLAARERHRLDKVAQHEADKQADADAHGHGSTFARRTVRSLRRAAVKPFAFLKPMALLLPRTVTDDEADDELRTNIEWGAHLDEYAHPKDVWRGKPSSSGSSASSSSRRDWALTKIALAYALNMGLMGVMTVKLLYARTEFGWAPTTTGYFLSYMGFMRLLTLLVVLPLGIKLLRRRPIPSPSRPRPTSSSDADVDTVAAEKQWDAEARWLKIVADSHFDLVLARLSLGIDTLGFLLFLVAPLLGAPRASSAHTAVFLVAVLVQSLGSGASPAIQSLALAHSTPRDAGRLFASLSVVQALAAQVVSPVLFTAVFSRTVGRFDEGIFALALALSAASFTALSSVRLRRVHVAAPGARTSSDGERGAVDEAAIGSAAVPASAQARAVAGGRKSKSSLVPQRGFEPEEEDHDDDVAAKGGRARGRGRGRERRGSWSAPVSEPYRD
ncbi:hypothetical protein JCM8208_001923 [Rhodotorula glutinis]